MTDVEKRAMEITNDLDTMVYNCEGGCVDIYGNIERAVLVGIREGKPKWHDLRKDPNDLPKEGVEVLVLYSNTYGNGGYIVNKHTLTYELAQYINDEEDTSEWYWVETGTDFDIQKVIAWCEIPEFEE